MTLADQNNTLTTDTTTTSDRTGNDAGLVLESVTLTYPDGDQRLVALDDVSLTVSPGEFTALVGPSGCGKSSLLAVAATLQQPDTGRVRLAGTWTTGLSKARTAALRRDRVGIVFQVPQLLGSLTAVEQIQVMGHLGGTLKVSRDEALALLDEVGLAAVADRLPRHLSGGQQQRINIARALVGSPGVLLVDEPTSALDHERGHEVMELLRRVTREHDTATVVVTHDVDLVRPDERVVRMLDGRLLPGTAD